MLGGKPEPRFRVFTEVNPEGEVYLAFFSYYKYMGLLTRAEGYLYYIEVLMSMKHGPTVFICDSASAGAACASH